MAVTSENQFIIHRIFCVQALILPPLRSFWCECLRSEKNGLKFLSVFCSNLSSNFLVDYNICFKNLSFCAHWSALPFIDLYLYVDVTEYVAHQLRILHSFILCIVYVCMMFSVAHLKNKAKHIWILNNNK